MKRLFCGLAVVICLIIGLSGCDTSVYSESSAPDISAPGDNTTSNIPPTEEMDIGENNTAPTDFVPGADQAAAPDNIVPELTGTKVPAGKDQADNGQGESPVQGIPTQPASSEDGAPSSTSTAQAPEISQITTLESGFSSASFSGDDGFEAFLAQGGADSDAAVTHFLAGQLPANIQLTAGAPGCSTLVVPGASGGALFGRNFDWQSCNALVVTSKPAAGYASISTVNLGFLTQAGAGEMLKENDARVMAALYAPLDGMNEKGLAISVNMIEDRATINQDTGKPDLTTTTAIRLLLNKAANVDEAIDLLRQHDMHASMGLMVHFAIGDNTGRGVVVEYVGNQMVVTETPVVTNFYLAEGSKHGIGSQQSHERYDILTQTLEDHPTMTAEEVRDALDSVSKDNFNEFESTEWSAVFNLNTGEAHYYHRENYSNRYTFFLD